MSAHVLKEDGATVANGVVARDRTMGGGYDFVGRTERSCGSLSHRPSQSSVAI